ncbi:polysaccharide pyruvyl transferase family protein [Caldifermentibacillus hisashii]|uniref:polysaccharide pyruvyl transferase family protein n=1 Tax=Caldifermentibacillus hisashii TaxID=996558 RepID=UPI002E05A5CF|nr:polysaccharide pyruvyl transferase family protein [Caldifermentibacillus hisashii]
MKKVMIYAYTKFNLGDDLFIKILIERYPNTKFLLYAPKKYRNVFRYNSNIRIIPSDLMLVRGLNYIARKLFKVDFFFRRFVSKRCDAAVHIGGSLFIQNNINWEKSWKMRKSMYINDKPFFLLGCNFGPFTDEEFYHQHRELFKKYTDICFRDNYSYNLFSDLKNVRVASDIVFSLNKLDIKDVEDRIVISVIKPSFRKNLNGYDEIYYKKIRDFTVYFIQQGYNVTLMSFCEHEGDNEALNNISKLIHEDLSEKVQLYFYTGNIDKALYEIAKSKLVIATRFHAMILGWVFSKPVFPIVYSDKMLNVIKDVHFNARYTNFRDLDKVEPSNVHENLKNNTLDITNERKNANAQFEILDKFLKRNY